MAQQGLGGVGEQNVLELRLRVLLAGWRDYLPTNRQVPAAPAIASVSDASKRGYG